MSDLEHTPRSPQELMQRYTFEIVCKDLPQVRAAIHAIPPGTRVNVTALGRESLAERIAAISGLIDLGLQPIPHIAARQATSTSQLTGFMASLAELGASEEVFIIGGDASEPQGPFGDALSLIESDILSSFGVRRVGIAVYPEGHPLISDRVLEEHFASKLRVLGDQGLEAYAISQFCFDAQAVSRSVGSIVAEADLAEVRIGVPGPTTVKRLLRYASQFGVRSSAGIVRKYGLSLTNLMSTAKPSTFIDDLAQSLPRTTGTPTSLHFYPFGAVGDTLSWANELARERG